MNDTSEPQLVDGGAVRGDGNLDDIVAAALRRRGIDPSVGDDPTCDIDTSSVLDPRGNVMDADEASEWFTEQALRALSFHAAGEFDFDRLPPVYPPVAEWIASQKRDSHEAPTLVLRGIVGCGKTSQCFHILRDLVLHHARKGVKYPWYFITHRNLAAVTQPRSSKDPETLERRLKRASLVVLSDLGDYNSQDFGTGRDLTSKIINHRWHYQLPTVYETNLLFTRTPKLVEREKELGVRIATLADCLDDRAVSRLQSGWVVNMPETNYRSRRGRVFNP